MNKMGAGFGRYSYGEENWAVSGRFAHRQSSDITTPDGIISGTSTNNFDGSVGLGFNTGKSLGGASLSIADMSYEIPDNIDNPDEGVEILMQRQAFQGRVNFNNSGFLDRGQVRFNASHMFQEEVEYVLDEGIRDEVVGLEYDKYALSSTLTMQHKPFGAFDRGAIGLNFHGHRLNVGGGQAYTPGEIRINLGMFTFQEIPLSNRVRLQAGLRIDFQHTGALSNVRFPDKTATRNAINYSGSIGFNYRPVEELEIGGQLARSHRNPSVEELYADGAHLGVGIYEIGNLDIKPDIPFLLLLNGRFEELQTISDKANDYLIRSYSFLALAKLEARKGNAPAAFNYCKSAANLVINLKKGDYRSLSIHAFICIMSALVMLKLKEYQSAVYFLNNSLDDNSNNRRGISFDIKVAERIYTVMMKYIYSQLTGKSCFFEIIHDSYKTIKADLQYKCLSLCALFVSADKENEKRLSGICSDLLLQAETDDSRMWIFEAYKEIADTFYQLNSLPVQRKHFKAFDFMDASCMEFIGLFLKSMLKSGDNETIIKLNDYLKGWDLFESFKHPLPFDYDGEIDDEINTASANIIAKSLQAYLDTNSKMELRNAISEGKKISVSKSTVVDDLNIAFLCANEDKVVKTAKKARNKSDVIFLMATIPELVREGFSEELGKKMVVDLLRKWRKCSNEE